MKNCIKLILLSCLVSNSYAGYEKGKQGIHAYKSFNPSAKSYSDANAKAYSDSFSKSSATGGKALATINGVQGGLGGNGGQGGTIQSGAVSNSMQGGSTTVSNVGNSSVNYPRQAPFAYSPGLAASFSQYNCANSISVGASTPFGGLGVGVADESDDCNRRSDSVRFQELGLANVACERMLIDSEENQAAMRNAGVNCRNVNKTSIAAPVAVVPPIATPALDNYQPGKLNKTLDDYHEYKMGK